MGGKNDKRPMSYGSSFGSMAAEAAVGDLIDYLRRVPETVEQATPDIATELNQEQAATVSAGNDAYGRPLTATREGNTPMQGAMSAITIEARGKQIGVILTGHEVAHQIGWARGYKGGSKMRRPVIPEPRKGIPARWVAAMRSVLRDALGLD